MALLMPASKLEEIGSSGEQIMCIMYKIAGKYTTVMFNNNFHARKSKYINDSIVGFFLIIVDREDISMRFTTWWISDRNFCEVERREPRR
jgi:hypothetical protein